MKIKYHLITFLFFLLAGVVLVSCGKENGTMVEPTTPSVSPTEPTVDLTTVRENIANNLANNLIRAAYADLKITTDNLATSIADFTNNPSGPTLANAQTALKDSWLTWQGASIYMFGPAETVALRKSLNTYPTDENQIDSNIETGDYILSSLANQAAVGFPAIDYL